MEFGTYCVNRETFGISINKEILKPVNTTNCSMFHDSNNKDLFSLPLRIVIGVSWLIVVLVGTVGNTLVLFVIGYVRSMRTIPNWLLFNLAIADGLMTIIALPILGLFQAVYYPVWEMPYWSCYVLNCFTHIGALASGSSLAIISVHRFIMIRYPRKIHITKKHLIVAIVLIWLIAIGGSVSSMMSAGVIGLVRPISGSLRLTRLCIQVNPTESRENFQLAFRLTMYTVFALFLFLLYSNIGLFIYRSKAPGHRMTTNKSEARKLQAVRMLATATAVMIISYLPYMVLVGLTLFAKPGYFSDVFAIEILCNIFSGLNHVVNPFIYCALSSNFSEAFKKFFRRIKNRKEDIDASGKGTTKVNLKKVSSIGLLGKKGNIISENDVSVNSQSKTLPAVASQITLNSFLEDSFEQTIVQANEPICEISKL